MARKYLFRGKEKVSGKWKYGNLQISEDPSEPTGIRGKEKDADGNDKQVMAIVDRDTVGQWVGQDQNKRDIFEGDLVKYWNKVDKKWYIAKVTYYDGGTVAATSGIPVLGQVLAEDQGTNYVEPEWENIVTVVGNIHDMPYWEQLLTCNDAPQEAAADE